MERSYYQCADSGLSRLVRLVRSYARRLPRHTTQVCTYTGRVNGHSRPSTYSLAHVPSTVWYDLTRPRTFAALAAVIRSREVWISSRLETAFERARARVSNVQNGIRCNNNIVVLVVIVVAVCLPSSPVCCRDTAWRERTARARFREGTRRFEPTRSPVFFNILLFLFSSIYFPTLSNVYHRDVP